MAILITSNITAEVFSVDIYREETERRWQIPITKTKEIHVSQTEGGIGYGNDEEGRAILITSQGI